MSDFERRDKVKKILKEVGLGEHVMDKYPHEFSGGQRQRIAIARALAVEPEILILDEPTTSLDVTIAAQIIKLLQKIQRERKLSYLFISHDLKTIKSMADDVAVMKNGKIIELNNHVALFKNPKRDYTKFLLSMT
jgi:microcin C transport system ATP-binding protein